MNALTVVSLAYSGFILAHQSITKAAGFNYAKQIAGEKGILNLGAGCDRDGWTEAVCENPRVLANVDIEGCEGPNCYLLNLDRDLLPFSERQFGAVFASHILEHLQNWDGALEEWCRVADQVVLVLPNPWCVMAWLAPQHRQHFTWGDKAAIEASYPQVTIFM